MKIKLSKYDIYHKLSLTFAVMLLSITFVNQIAPYVINPNTIVFEFMEEINEKRIRNCQMRSCLLLMFRKCKMQGMSFR